MIRAMQVVITLLYVLPTLVFSSGEGNIRLLEDEVASALRSCYNDSTLQSRNSGGIRRSRSNDYFQGQYGRQIPRMDNDVKQNYMNHYNHERRNATQQMYVLNGTENDIPGYGRTDSSVKYVKSVLLPSQIAHNYRTSNRKSRGVSLINYSDQDQCLSQCVFANLQVVDVRGIPREAELWNIVQTAVTSRQSRIVLRDQVRACFQELESEDEDNGCSYSNKLENCLMLRFSDRILNGKA